MRDNILNQKKACDFQHTYPEAELNDLLLRRDYETILKSADAFRSAFLKTCLDGTGHSHHYLTVTLKKHSYSVIGHISSCNCAFERLEQLRTLLVKKWDKRQNLTLYCTKNPYDTDERVVTKAERIPNKQAKHVITRLNSLSANLSALFTLINAKYAAENFLLHGKEGILRTVTWGEDRTVYLIPPKAITSGNPLTKQLYDAYKNGEWCDFTLIASDETAIKVHRVVLAVAGAFPKKCLQSGMVESKENSITFPEFSRSTVQAYAEYLYLGGEAFIAKCAAAAVEQELNLMELLHFAHVHSEPILFDCCTNILALSAKSEDYAVLLETAERYDSPHLKQLAAKFAPQTGAEALKKQ